MKKIFCIILIACNIFTVLLLNGVETNASSNTTGVPYKTFTSVSGELRETKTAYLPLGVLKTTFELNAPSDIFIFKGKIYVANTGGKNIIVSDLNGNLLTTIGDGFLSSPTGIFVDNDYLYVSDKGLSMVIKYDLKYNLIKTFSRPNDPLYGNNTVFKPEKIVVDKRGNIYLTGSESLNGVTQLNKEGEFLGYFGVNQTKINFKTIFNDLMNLKDIIASNLPPAPSNIAIDEKGIIYTLTTTGNPSIKKLNLSGNIILGLNPYREEEQVLDIWVDEYNNIFVTTTYGTIYEFDEYGNLLFCFGGYDTGENRLGLLANPKGISLDEEGNIYCIDENYSQIQVYVKTNFASLVHESIRLYSEGKIDESQQLFEEIKDLNETFNLANKNLGNIYIKQNRYDEALDCFYIAKDKIGYSNAFWEIRNKWLVDYTGLIISILLGITLIYITFKITKINKKIKKKIENFRFKLEEKKIINEMFYLVKIIKKPVDCFYEIKKCNASSYLSATIIYISTFIMLIVSYFVTSFIFQNNDVNEINFLIEIVKYFGIVGLFITSNYLVSTLFDGEGKFKDIYISTAYCLAPIFFSIIPISILSNCLTLNEEFVIIFLKIIIYSYSIILLFIMIKDIHNYSFKSTIRNVLLTILIMILIVITLFIIYLLLNQLFDFIVSTIKEVFSRVKG